MATYITFKDRELLSGLVERVTFHSPETGFCVLRVKVRGHRELVTVLGSTYSRIVGLMPSHEGCRLALNNRAPPGLTGWPKFNGDDLPPSLQPHYRAFITTTRQSAPLRRIGTFGLAVVAACAFSLGIAGQVLRLPYKSLVELRATYMPDAVRAAFRSAPGLIPEEGSPPGSDIV